MADAMKSTASAMMKMNKAVNVPSINKMMLEFQRENAKSEMMQEIMADALDDAMEQEGDAEEEDRIVNQVLDEIGIGFADGIPDAPQQIASSGTKQEERIPEAAGDPALDDLEARLNNLKR